MSRAYYNEIDPGTAATIRQLIAAKMIAPGDVDERSIEDVHPTDLLGYTQCHFFAGIGVWSYALRLAGWPDDRQVWTGSCPCQPFSAAGKGEGFADERDLWPAFAWLIRQRRPAIVAGEQVAGKSVGPWIDRLCDDLEAVGYSCGAVAFPACSVGAPHIRPRTYWVADAKRNEQSRQEPRRGPIGRVGRVKQSVPWDRHWRAALSELRSMDDVHPRCVGATDAIRNAIVAQQAQAFIEAYCEVRASA